MRVIEFKSEKGGSLITVVGIIVSLATIGVILATLSSSSSTLQMIDSEGQRAFYAAQSGMEYGIKEYLSAENIEDWNVVGLNAGDGISSDVSLVVNEESNEITITSVGKSARASKVLTTVISKTDSNNVPDFAVFSKRPVRNILAKDSLGGENNSRLIYQNAAAVPVFDNDKLRALAARVQEDGNAYYFEDDLIVDEDFSPPDGTVVFSEGKIKFAKGTWDGDVYFVAMDNISFLSTWRNSEDVSMTIYLGEPDKKIWIEPRNYDEDPVVFDIDNGEVTPTEPYAAKITVVGCGFEAFIGNRKVYDAPITLQIKVGDEIIKPFGPNPTRYERRRRNKVTQGNVNKPGHFPMEYVLPNIYRAGTSISVLARGWEQQFIGWFWRWGFGTYFLIDQANSANANDADIVKVLRDGDRVPNVQGFGSQRSAEEFIGSYINFETKRVTLDDNQAIYLIELSNLGPNAPGTDFQDAVVLVTLAKERDDFIPEPGPGEIEDENLLSFTGGIISDAPVYGASVDMYEENEISSKIQVIHDNKIINDFLKYSVNGNSRVLLKTKWTRKD